MGEWNETSIPDLTGRVAIVTGASAGLGLATTRLLVGHGARVVMACRDKTKALAAVTARGIDPGRGVVEVLDLADQSSVTRFADEVGRRHERLDLLVNNAGLASVNQSTTVDGFETHLGVNHLGHMALTLRLLPMLTATTGSRVVTLTSSGHRNGRIRLSDPHFTNGGYGRMRAYTQSKLANLLFALELGRRLEAAGHSTLSLAADPGIARTELSTKDTNRTMLIVARLAPYLIPNHSADRGALPTLRAATDPGVRSGQLYAPRWGLVGPPVVQTPARHALDVELAARLWQLSTTMLARIDSSIPLAE